MGAKLIAGVQALLITLGLDLALTAGLGYPEREGLIFVPLFALSLWRAWRLGVVVTDETIVVRNFWRTYEIPWSDVARIEYASFWPSPVALTLATVIAIKRKGTRVPVFVQALVGRSGRQITGLEAAARGHPSVSVESWT
jgi:Bacterial PH domain